MRGKVSSFLSLLSLFRITPAYAGKSFIIDCHLQAGRDHPRLCGEKPNAKSATAIAIGSPPPMRGKGRSCTGSLGVVRITPAYAGKSPSWIRPMTDKQDHPRLCGEKAENCHNIVKIQGSPPPMRGKGRGRAAAFSDYRITPAYAGKRNE